MQIPELSPELLKILVPAIFTLLGVLLGNYLTHRNSYNLFTKQKTFDNQRISFSRIMSLKIPWTQSIHTNIEAKLLTEFYETRYLLFSHDVEDLIESKKQYERALLLIKDISREQKEVFETLGLIQTCFKIDKELQIAIDDMFNYKSIDISTFPKNFKTINELDEFLTKKSASIHPLIQKEYRDKFDNLIAILKPRLINSK